MSATPGYQPDPYARQLSLVFSRALGKVIVHIYGALDAGTAHQLRDRLVDVIDGQGNRNLVLDLRGTTHVDDAGMAVLLDAKWRMDGIEGEIVLNGPSRSVADVLAAAGLDKLFVITPAWTHPAHGDVRSDVGQGR